MDVGVKALLNSDDQVKTLFEWVRDKKISLKEFRAILGDKTNFCHHEKTHACGMDRVCDQCGAWV